MGLDRRHFAIAAYGARTSSLRSTHRTHRTHRHAQLRGLASETGRTRPKKKKSPAGQRTNNLGSSQFGELLAGQRRA
jgi:hypothetical protein